MDKIFKDRPRFNGGTKAQRLARERNWCVRILRAMRGLTLYMYSRERISHPTYMGLKRAIDAAVYNLDVLYYHDLDKIRASK